MTDRHLRELERRAATGDVEDAARLLRARLRAGLVTAEQVAIAAWGGDGAARLALDGAAPGGVELVDVAWRRIEQWLLARAPGRLVDLRPGADGSAIAALERALGRPVPPALAASWRAHDGQAPGSAPLFRGSWALLPVDAARERRDALQARFEGRTGDDPDIATPRHPEEVRPVRWSAGWIPFAESALGDTLCVDLDPAPRGTPGQVVLRTRTWTYVLLAPGVEAALAAFARDLDAGSARVAGDEPPDGDEPRAAAEPAAKTKTKEKKRPAAKRKTKKRPAAKRKPS